MTHPRAILVVLACLIAVAADETRAAEWEIGARATILAGDAPPANDMPGAGLVVRRVADEWTVGVALEQYSYDYEEPYRVLGIGLSPAFPEEALDGTTDATVISAWAERRYDTGGAGGLSWFWTAGLGYAFISTDAVTGPAAGGGTFDIATQASDELHLLASGGLRYAFAGGWYVDAALHAQHHFIDYDLVDRVSGATGEIDAQTLFGVSAGVGYRF